jgi:uncharacterized protein YecE (DUF72 family)
MSPSSDHDPGPAAARARADATGGAHPASTVLETRNGGRMLIGTASWTDPTITAPGVFYPEGAHSPEERLRYYASRFPLVEVDSAYYGLPSERVAALWVERTPPRFTFNLKAFSLMTGQPAQVRSLPKAIREALPEAAAGKARVYPRDVPDEVMDQVWSTYVDALEPLRSSGKLGAVLLQYPRWFVPSKENAADLVRATERLAAHDVPCAVELRNRLWFGDEKRKTERTLAWLREHDIPFVMVDGPQGFESSVPPVAAVTSKALAVLRMHGRNRETWEARGVPTVERYRYLYDAKELAEWGERVAEVAESAKEMHILFNNCYANYGTTNAIEFTELMRKVVKQEAGSRNQASP